MLANLKLTKKILIFIIYYIQKISSIYIHILIYKFQNLYYTSMSLKNSILEILQIIQSCKLI